MPDKHLRKQPKEVPATLDRDVEDNSFDWQRAGGGSDVEAIGEAGQTPGQGEPTESSPVQPGPDYNGPVCQDTKSGEYPCSLLPSLLQNA
jgi:hypothetical protein